MLSVFTSPGDDVQRGYPGYLISNSMFDVALLLAGALIIISTLFVGDDELINTGLPAGTMILYTQQ